MKRNRVTHKRIAPQGGCGRGSLINVLQREDLHVVLRSIPNLWQKTDQAQQQFHSVMSHHTHNVETICEPCGTKMNSL